MSIRVGVDVGGTFTKAVAFDTTAGRLAAEAVVATTHDHPDGVAAGVVDVVGRLTKDVGADRVELVTHSTTQAVNAMLEGDVATVGMVGMGRAPDLRKARQRTVMPRIELGEGRTLATVWEFIDVTGGLTAQTAREVVTRLRDAGAEAIAAAEAFAPDDLSHERTVAEAAADIGLPVTTSAELTGLYGLELRAVTAALNASIIPIALRTAEVVGAGVAAAGVASPVMVMRGDAGATDLAGFRTAPARTLYSGPAASVAGALRTSRIDDGVILEVGGTSTNVAAIRRGRPALSYVQVASHSTAIRALDVRVFGVAGGSMLRARRNRVHGVGPRSAHIAGLPYACFLTPEELDGASAELLAPRPGDPADYLVLRLADGRRAALTITCAANVLGIVVPEDYARGSCAAATAGFAAAGRELRLPVHEVARRMMAAATQAIGDIVAKVMRDHRLKRPTVVAVGGGAGALGRAVATAMDLDIHIPPSAEIISAIGDALSLVRAERERTMSQATPAQVQQLVAEVEAEAVAAGAGVATLEARVEHIADRGSVRVTVTGSVGLSSGAVPGRRSATQQEAADTARARGHRDTSAVGPYWLARGAENGTRVALLDQYGDIVLDVRGEALAFSPQDPTSVLVDALNRCSRRLGPVTVEPTAWVVKGARCVQVPDLEPGTILDTVAMQDTGGAPATIIIGRE